MWILFTTIYGVLIGFFTVLRKTASQKSNILFVLAFSSTLGFLFVSWSAPEAFLVGWQNILLILGKAFIVALAWVSELIALKNYFISSLQPISAIKVVVSFVASLLIFGETFVWWKFIGVALIFVSLILLNHFDKVFLKKEGFKNKFALAQSSLKCMKKYKNSFFSDYKFVYKNQIHEKLRSNRAKAVIFFSLSCLLNVTSGILDKFILNNVSTNQMQFYFMLFVSVIIWIFFFLFCLKEKKMLVHKSDWKNWVIYVLPIILIVADRFLFNALSQPDVLVSGVSIIKQLSTVVAVVFGGLLYKEPNLKIKLLFLLPILAGVAIVVF